MAKPRAPVYDGLLADAMQLVGERWVSGQWSIAEEHLASQTLIRTLDRVRPQLGPEGRVGPLAVLAGVAGEHHTIGLICLEHVLGEGGWTVARLGEDVPADDLAGFVARNQTRLVAITASDPARLEVVSQTVAAVRQAGRSDIAIMLGGRMGGSRGVAQQTGVDRSGTTFVGAGAFADGVLAAHPWRGLSPVQDPGQT